MNMVAAILAAKEMRKSCHTAKSPPLVAVADLSIAKSFIICYTEYMRKSETWVMQEC